MLAHKAGLQLPQAVHNYIGCTPALFVASVLLSWRLFATLSVVRGSMHAHTYAVYARNVHGHMHDAALKHTDHVHSMHVGASSFSYI
jgi:hypothetical protein